MTRSLAKDLFGPVNVVTNSVLPGLRFFVHCICIIMWHSHLNDMEIPETKRFIPKGFELGTTMSWKNRYILGRKVEWELCPVPTLI